MIIRLINASQPLETERPKTKIYLILPNIMDSVTYTL